MASPKLPFFLLLLATLAAAAPAQEYCQDSLAGLMDCRSFMFGGTPAPSAACCAAYSAAFDADPFCLCYVADGTYGRATGLDVDVARALEIPAGCGQAAPPVELCNMQGLVLPPYASEGSPAAAAPTAQPPSGSVAPPSFVSPPPPPAPTSDTEHDSSLKLTILVAILVAAAAVAMALV